MAEDGEPEAKRVKVEGPSGETPTASGKPAEQGAPCAEQRSGAGAGPSGAPAAAPPAAGPGASAPGAAAPKAEAGASVAAAAVAGGRDVWLQKQEEEGDLVFRTVHNDGEEQSMLRLIDLKNIYAKQLPNMPREYIVRLVLDRGHRSLLLLKGGEAGTVVGGITYRPFYPQALGEIAFCAVSASEQVKGYGTRLMNRLKDHVAEEEKLTHLITFADNNAVGYFQKQGFTKEILMEREKWSGYIKEYDGGTLMECILTSSVKYSDFPRVIRQQREALEAKVRELSSSHIVHPGLCNGPAAGAAGAAGGPPGEGGSDEAAGGVASGRVPPDQIPGVREAGWEPTVPRFRLVLPGGCGDGMPTPPNMHRFMRSILRIVHEHQDSWPFQDPVSVEEVPDYLDVVKDPIDLKAIGTRVEREDYYVTLEMFAADFRRMFNNCRTYNAPDTVYYKCANRLEQYFESKVASGISWVKQRG